MLTTTRYTKELTIFISCHFVCFVVWIKRAKFESTPKIYPRRSDARLNGIFLHLVPVDGGGFFNFENMDNFWILRWLVSNPLLDSEPLNRSGFGWFRWERASFQWRGKPDARLRNWLISAALAFPSPLRFLSVWGSEFGLTVNLTRRPG